VIALQQEQEPPRPIYRSAQVYYTDFSCEQRKSKFTITQRDWNIIRCDNDPSKLLAEKAKTLIGNIENKINRDSSGKAYLSYEAIEDIILCKKWQIIQLRKQFAHIFHSNWRKTVKIDGIVRHNVIVFQYTDNGKDILNNPYKYYKNVKACGYTNASIYKDEKYIKDRSSKSSFCKNSNSSQAKVYSPKFKQYDQLKTLGEHYPLTAKDCSELQRRSGREFTLNAMNEILLDMSRKLKESKHKFPSKAAFMAYMRKVYRYEGRDAVKTANTGFKILTRAPEAEVIAHTTQAERESYLAEVEQRAIIHRSDETQYRAKLAATLKPSQAYNFLSNLKTVCKVGDVFEVHMSQNVLLTDHSLALMLSAANAVGGYSGVRKMEVVSQKLNATSLVDLNRLASQI
jgi:hypothetical protein